MMELPVDSFIKNLEMQEEYSARTLRAYASDTQRFVEFLNSVEGRPPQLLDFNAVLINKFLESELYGGRKRSTVSRRRASLRRFGEYLRDQELIDTDPTIEQGLPDRRKKRRFWKRRKPKILRDKEIERIFELMRKSNSPRALRDIAILGIILETGISISTLVGMDVSDFDLQNMRIQVMPDGFSDAYWLFIPQSGGLLPEYLREGRPNLTDSHIETALFVSQMGGRISRQAIWQALRIWGKHAKLKQKLSPRLLRSTAVIRMCSKGLTVAQIQRLLGHRNQLSTRAMLRRINVRAGK